LIGQRRKHPDPCRGVTNCQRHEYRDEECRLGDCRTQVVISRGDSDLIYHMLTPNTKVLVIKWLMIERTDSNAEKTSWRDRFDRIAVLSGSLWWAWTPRLHPWHQERLNIRNGVKQRVASSRSVT
jgi:hypothetical protein